MSDPAPRLVPVAAGGGGEPPVFGNDGTRPATVLSRDETRDLIRACGIGPADLARRDRALISTLYYGALRSVEAHDLDVDRIDWARGVLALWQRKTRRWRVVAMHREMVGPLQAWVRLSGPGGHSAPTRRPVFYSRKGHRLSTSAMRRLMHRRGELAGIDAGKLGTHVLRASRLTHLAEAGVPLVALQDLAGHASPRTTSRYLRSSQGWAARFALEHGL